MVYTASNEKTSDETPKLNVLTDVGSWELEKPNHV
jgi:hypothetical protein